MKSLFDTPVEESRHRHAIASLAHDMHQPIEQITQVYERELSELKAAARIKDYLVPLTCRHVRDRLRKARRNSGR